MVINRSNDPNRAYLNIFRTYIARNTEFALMRVQNTKYSLSIEDQKLVLKTLNYALKSEEAWPIARDLLISAAPKMEQAGYRAEWMFYLESGIQRCKESKEEQDAFAEAKLHFNVGILYQHKADFHNARFRFNYSAIKFKEIGSRVHQARSLNQLAYIARLQRRFEEAKKILDAAEILAAGSTPEAAYSYLVRGCLALDQGDPTNALNFFKNSLDLWKKTENKRKIAWGLSNYGTVLRVLKKYDQAISSYEKAIYVFKEVKDPVHQAVAQMNLGNVYLDLQKAEKALYFYHLSESIFYDAQAKLRFAKVNHNKAIAYQQLKHWNQAECAYSSSIEQWREIGSISSMVKVIIPLAEMYIQQGSKEKANKTLHEALNTLHQIKGEPEYNTLLSTITNLLHKPSL